MEKLVEHVLGLPQEDLRHVSLQDMALCHIFGQSYPEGNGIETEKLPQRIEDWLACTEQELLDTEGRRHQTLLRELIDELQQAKIGSLAHDELRLLATVYELTDRAAAPARFDRIREVLKHFIPTIARRLDTSIGPKGLPTLSKKLRVVTTEDIKHCRQKEVNVLAGIKLPCRGPLLTHRGHLRVLGDVPENTTVVVEQGHCIVDGYVMGRIAVTGLCEVRHNISGVVIARDGDVRAHTIVDNARVISKTGNVICTRAQRPELVFGGLHIDVKEDTIQGRFVSRCIDVHGAAIGGEFHLTESIRTPHFHQEENRPLAIVFRRRLSCRDYGEEPGREMARMLSRATRLRDRLVYAKRSTSLAGKEVEQFASTALMYILGGEQVKEALEEIVLAHRRLDILNRIVMGLHTLYGETELKLRSKGSEDDAEKADEPQPLDQLFSDVDEYSKETPVDKDILEVRDEMSEMEKKIEQGGQNRSLLTSTMTGLSKKLTLWLTESEELKLKIRTQEKIVQEAVGLKDLAAKGGSKAPNVMALRQIMEAAKKRGAKDPVYVRSQSSFVSIMLRNIRKRIQSATKFRETAQQTRVEFEKAAEAVWTNYQVRIEEPNEDEERCATATGRYDKEVRLLTDPALLEEDAPTLNGQYFITPELHSKEVTFQCGAGTITERPD